ncbi:hypothetical protein J3R83DRAFT_7787 [Lanmaoa asiatica]|nr:hypothetical protein J3R83DRAFT_7787 [Lanmaoa asiatica]
MMCRRRSSPKVAKFSAVVFAVFRICQSSSLSRCMPVLLKKSPFRQWLFIAVIIPVGIPTPRPEPVSHPSTLIQKPRGEVSRIRTLSELSTPTEGSKDVTRPRYFNLNSYLRTSFPLVGPQKFPHNLVDKHTKQEMTLTTVNAPDFLDPPLFFPRSAIPSLFIPQSFWEGGLSLHSAAERAIDCILEQLIALNVYSEEEKKWNLDTLWMLVGSGNRKHEKVVAELFNMVVSTALSLCGKSISFHTWRSHESHLAESLRKPDVVLVPIHQKRQPTANFRNFQTYCEVKESDNPQLVKIAKAQITEMANIVGSMQIDRRFFVGSYLCGPLLHIALHARGCTLFSPSGLDISEHPRDFIAVILHLSAGSLNPAWNGFDSAIQDPGESFLTLDWEQPGNCKRIRLTRPLHTSLCLRGSSTRVWVCDVLTQDEHDKGPAWKTCILKDCWMDQGFPADIQIHELLNSRTPKAFPDVTHEEVFGPKDAFNVFKDCVQVDGHWDHASHLRGIPLVRASVVPTCDAPTLDSEGQVVMKKLPDTTTNILKRFFKGSAEWAEDSHQIRGFSYEPRQHIRLVYDTIATSVVWFSCRREFFNGIMCATIAHYNGLRMDLLHCDGSDTNIWFKVRSLKTDHVAPDFPQNGYTKRAGILGDWGLAEDQRAMGDCVAPGHITGTFPFTASQLLSPEGLRGEVRHTAHHDLESLFWLIWVTSVNLEGPFGRQRAWESTSDSTSVSAFASASVSASTPASASAASSSMAETTSRPTRCTFPLQLRCPVNRHTSFPGVPIWATPGLHTVTEADVYSWKQAIPPTQFFPSIDPYWTSGTGGTKFVEGMTQLREHFVWIVEHDAKIGGPVSRPPKKPITHLEFLVLLKLMRDAIGDEDAPTPQDIEKARAEYKHIVQNSSFQHGMVESFGPRAYLPPTMSSKRQRKEEGNRCVSPPATRRSSKISRRL